MKVSILGTLPPIKGISVYCKEQVESLAKKTKVEFFNFKSIYPEFFYPGETKEKKDFFLVEPNENLEIKNFLTWYNPFSWIRVGLFSQGEVFHFHWWSFVLFPIFLTILSLIKLRRKKIICTVHNVKSHERDKINKTLSRLIFKFPDYFIVHSKENKEKLKKIFKIKENRIFVIPYGPLDFYKTKNISKKTARKKLGFKNKDKIILYFGNIRKYKGVDVLIKAFSQVKKKIPQAKLLIIGKNWIDWQPFQDIIERNSLKENIFLKLDYIPGFEVQYYFLAADLVVLPYLNFDAQSGVGNIALAFKKALIVTKVGGLPELVNDKNVIVKPGDPADLARAIIRILKNDNFRKKLEGDSKKMTKKYSWDKITEKTIKLYKLLIHGKN